MLNIGNTNLLFLLICTIFFSFFFIFQKEKLKLFILSNIKSLFFITLITSLYFLFYSDALIGNFGYHRDNFGYALPFFTYMLQGISFSNELPYWNMFVNHGEPTFLFLNNNYLLHLTYLPFYIFSPFFSNFEPVKLFLFVIIFSNFVQAALLSYLVYLLTKNNKIFFYSFLVSLFSGFAIGEVHQIQANATIIYIIISSIFFIKWFQSQNIIYWYFSLFFLSHSFLNHYQHLILYFISTLIISIFLFNKNLFDEIYIKISKIRLIHLIGSSLLFFSISLLPLYLYYLYHDLFISPFRGGELASNYQYIINSSSNNSLNPHTILHYFFPKTFFKTHLGQNSMDNYLYYIGIIPVLFSILFIFIKNKKHLFLKIFLLFILIMSFGSHSFGYFLLYKFIPFADLQRLPAQLSYFLAPLLILISSLSLNHIFNLRGNFSFNISKNYLILSLIGLSLLVISIYYLLRGYDVQVIRFFLDDFVFLTFFSVTFLWLLKNTKSKKFFHILFILLIIDIGSYSHRNISQNLFNNIDKKYFDLPKNEEIFKYSEKSNFYNNSDFIKIYHALLFGEMYFNLDEPILLNKNYKNNIEKNNL